MNHIDSFNRIVTEIEKLVGYDDDYGCLKAEDIIGKLKKQEGKSARDLSTIFEFISGKSLNKYVKDRKMMATYKKMINDDDYDVQSYVECSGYDTESSFSTGFSKKFGIPPKQAFQQKDKEKIEPPLKIGVMESKSEQVEVITDIAEKKFGLPKDVIDRYEEIREYKAMFGLNDLCVELAVFLNEEKGADLKEAFKSVESLAREFDFELDCADPETLEELIDFAYEEAPAVYVKHLYPDVYLTELNTWYNVLKQEAHVSIKEALEEKQEFVRVFIDNVSSDYSYQELKEMYNDYLKSYADRYDFKEYVEYGGDEWWLDLI